MPDPKVGDTIVVKAIVNSITKDGVIVKTADGCCRFFFKKEWCEVIPAPIQLYVGHTYTETINGRDYPRTVVWFDDESVVFTMVTHNRGLCSKQDFIKRMTKKG